MSDVCDVIVWGLPGNTRVAAVLEWASTVFYYFMIGGAGQFGTLNFFWENTFNI